MKGYKLVNMKTGQVKVFRTLEDACSALRLSHTIPENMKRVFDAFEAGNVITIRKVPHTPSIVELEQ